MGLDMWFSDEDDESELVHWRKHYELHELILEEFGDRIKASDFDEVHMGLQDVQRLLDMAKFLELDGLDKLQEMIERMDSSPGMRVIYHSSR